jgi:uncharacterized repeat protein (TIGR03803 family)
MRNREFLRIFSANATADATIIERCGSALALLLFWGAMSFAAQAQTYTTLFNFDGTHGANPGSRLIQGADGSLYGVTARGGINRGCQGGGWGCGTIFKITTSGALTILHVFTETDGSVPVGPLIQAADGNFYGTTNGGGLHRQGTIFEMAPDGTLTTFHNFNLAGGSSPAGGLLQAPNTNFYGTTRNGGAHLAGTVFTITSSGVLTTLYSFCAKTNCADGSSPVGTLVLATDGNFYGITDAGGINKFGTVFKITPGGTLTTLYSFCSKLNCSDGASPNPNLVQGKDGNFYGTTYQGGANFGTIFKITSTGTFTNLHNFCATTGCRDGSNPLAGVIQASDGKFYGTTTAGGKFSRGAIFKMSQSGGVTNLYQFQASDGQFPRQLLQAADGNFYGTTEIGGKGVGTVFGLSTGLAP